MNPQIRMLLLLQFLGGALIVGERTFFPLYTSALEMTPALIAAVSGTRQLTGMVAALIGGYVVNRTGKKWSYFFGNIGFLVAGVLFFFTSHAAVSLLWISGGFFLGIRTLGGQSYLVAASTSENIGTMSALFTWGTTLGGALGTLVLGFLIDRAGYASFAWSLIGLSVLLLLVNGTAMPRLEPSSNSSSRTRVRYSDIVKRTEVLLLTALRFIPTFYWGMAVVLVPILLVDLGASTMTVATFGTVSQIVASIAQIATGRAADRIGPKIPSIIALATLGLSILGTALFPGTLVLVFITSVGAAAAAWSVSALLPVLVATTMKKSEHAHAFGWLHLWWSIGMVSGAWIGGSLYQVAPWIPFLVAGILNMGTPYVAWRLLRQREAR